MKDGIVLNRVSFAYQNSSKQLKNVSLNINKGGFYAITGTNGSGKTTLSLLLNGLIPHQIKGKLDGNIFINGINTRNKPVSYFARLVGMVFQNPDFMLFNLTVKEEIEFGIKNLKLDRRNDRITRALKVTGMAGYEEHDPQTLSFGQKQKICLTCILAQDSEYIVLDEPSAMLDYPSTVRLYKLLRSLNQDGKTIIIIEHDTDFIYSYASHTIILDQGQIILEGGTKKVFSQRDKIKQTGIKIPNQLL